MLAMMLVIRFNTYISLANPITLLAPSSEVGPRSRQVGPVERLIEPYKIV